MNAAAADLEALQAGLHPSPFGVLGPQVNPRGGIIVRAFLPWAAAAGVVVDGSERAAQTSGDGLYAVELAGDTLAPATYQWAVRHQDGRALRFADPYAFRPLLDERDLLRFEAGSHMAVYELLGAHYEERQGVWGTRFAVWAPGAKACLVMGSFNGWDGRCHPMRRRPAYGVWELFVPQAAPDAVYKYEIHGHQPGVRTRKADPYGFRMEVRPATASIVWHQEPYRWTDAEWMDRRSKRQADDQPLSIYEVHLGSWRRPLSGDSDGEADFLTYEALAAQLIPHVQALGHTHIELLPITEHPFDGSWGYQTVGYFAPTARHGSPDGFRAFVDAAHQAGIGVILDWVPAHFPRDAHGLGTFDGTHLYEHADPRRGAHPDWGTYIYNFGLPQVSAFLLSSALFWLREYHIDGLRVDAVASMLYLDYSRKAGEWLPNRYGGRENLEALEFLRRLNREVHAAYAEVLTFAEESTSWPGMTRSVDEGGLGFDYKWNMGWMNDTLEYVGTDPVFRKGLHERFTFSIHYAFSERFLLPLSHDEVVHGKSSLLGKAPGERHQKFATMRALLAFMYAHPGKKLLFMGTEIGLWREWDFEGSLDWELLEHPPHQGMERLVRALLRLYRADPCLHQVDARHEGFEWVERTDADRSVIAFLRWDRDRQQHLLAVGNFTPVKWRNYCLPVPLDAGRYVPVFNSNAAEYGGDATVLPELDVEPLEGGRPRDAGVSWTHCLSADLEPLSFVYWKPAAD